MRGGILATSGRAAALLAALATHALVARLLSPSEVGLYFLVISIVTVASTCGQLGLPKTTVLLMSEALAQEDVDRARAIGASSLRLAFVGGLATASLLAGPGVLVTGLLTTSTTIPLMILASIWSLGKVMETMTAEIFRGFKQIGRAVCFNSLLSNAFLLATLVVLLVLKVDAGWQPETAHIVGCAVATVLVVALLGVKMIERQGMSLTRRGDPTWGQLLSASWPVLGTTLLFMVWEALGFWILAAVTHEASELALFGAAVRVSGLVIMPLAITNAVLMPVIAQLHAQNDRRRLAAALRLFATITSIPALAVTLVLIIAGESLLGMVFGSAYRAGAPLLSFLSMAHLINSWTGSCGLTLLMSGRQKLHLLLNALSLAALLLVAVPLTRMHGALGMAFATLLGILFQQTLFLAVTRWSVGIWTCATLDRRRLRDFWRSLPYAIQKPRTAR